MNAVVYAETQLGVHTVYDEAQKEYAAYVAATDRLEDTETAIRSYTEKVERREAELTAENYAATAGLKTATERKAYMAQVHDADPQLKDFHDRLRTLAADKRLAQRDISVNKMGLELRIARMQELGGLLQFYAVAKAADQSPHTSQVQEGTGS